MIRQAKPKDVFDGKTSFTARAIIGLDLADIASAYRFRMLTGEDGLDAFEMVPLILEESGSAQLKFALWRHAGNPANTFSIRLPMEQEHPELCVAFIAEGLGIPEDKILWQDGTGSHPALAEKPGDNSLEPA